MSSSSPTAPSPNLLGLMQVGSEVLEKAAESAALPAPVEIRCDVAEGTVHIWTHETGAADQYAAINRVADVLGTCPEVTTQSAPREVRAQGAWEGVQVNLRAFQAEPRRGRAANHPTPPAVTERTVRLLREARNWIMSMKGTDAIAELSLTDRSARYGQHLLTILATDADAARTFRIPMRLRMRWLAGGMGKVRCIVRSVTDAS
ncbi:hypothetical protein [Streptomyces sp. NBC_01601]|uniref:hypothetical protein n=1 Tax=Streptomyces sp. NBC_01601 TaxID=2975892 RepID=UPI002E2A6F8E|nr:hypothetical protein [Streptomyces sp. NBC_01601]